MLVWVSSPLTVSRAELLHGIIPGARRAQVLAASIGFALAVAALASAAGIAAALYCWRRDSSLANVARYAALLSAPIPPYLHALAWLPLCAALPGRGAGSISGWISAIWVQMLAVLPFCFGLAYFALQSLDQRTLEAARVYGSDRQTLLRVLLPLLRPAWLAAAALALLLTLTDHAVASLFSRSTSSLEIFEQFSASHDAAQALVAAIPLLLATLLLLFPLAHFWKSCAQRPAGRNSRQEPLRLRGWAAHGLAAGAILLVLPFAALLATLLRQGGRPAVWGQSLLAGAHDAGTSAGAALAAALVAGTISIAVSRIVRSRPVLGWWIVCAPLAVPSALVGVGLIWLWNRSLPFTPYGTVAILGLAILARFLPLAVLAVAAWRSRLDPELLEAGQVFASPRRAMLEIELPLLLPGIGAGAAVVFLLGLGELGATLLVVPPGSGTLALRIYNYLHYGASDSVAALALCLIGLSSAAVLAAVRWWRSHA